MDDEVEENVTIRFVMPENKDEFSVSESMSRAYDQVSESGLNAEWIPEASVMALSPTKTDVFVLEEFDTKVYKHLTKGDKIKCTVLGPKALSACIQTNTPVPNLPYPMYTLAMKGVQITCSHVPKEEKEKLQNLIQRMAGVYSADFHDGITHVVTCSVTSEKYRVAVENSTPVMTTDWVHEVWEASNRELVSAIDPRFLQYKCPAFCGLTVCVTQLNKADKNTLKKKLEAHGGSYQPELQMDTTNLLVCVTADGSKYTHAIKWKIPCVTTDWIMDSIDKGYALPFDNYKVLKSNKASTPTKDTSGIDRFADVSMCSAILNPDESSFSSRIDDTVNCTSIGTIAPLILGKTTKDWLSELELPRVKKAGHFLDGLRIYLSGFQEADQVQMTRVLKHAGATRLTQLVDSVTHVLHSVGKQVDPDTAKITRDLGITPHSVSLEWIVESMKRGTKVSEEDYMFPPPPEEVIQKEKLSRTVLENVGTNSPDKTLVEDNILQQYKQASANKPGTTAKSESRMEQSSAMGEHSTQMEPFFADLKFELAGLPLEVEQEFVEWITEVGGEVMFSDYQGTVDYLITPLEGHVGKLKHKVHLTNYWVDDCLDQCELVPIEYYHYPIKKKGTSPLEGIVTCVSGYANKERIYISNAISLLGGIPQEMFAKKEKKEKGVLASTHLVCNGPEGPKYNAALSWGVPVVTKDWVRACLKEWKWISEKPFLLGNSTAFNKDKPLPSLPLEDDVTLVEAEEADDDKEATLEETAVQQDGDQEDTILQDIDQNKSTRSSLARRKSNQAIADKANISATKERRESEVVERRSSRGGDLKRVSRGGEEVKTPVQTSVNKLSANTNQEQKTPGLTPGIDRVRKPLDMYSPLPSQPWPDSQAMCTPGNGLATGSGVKRKRDTSNDELADMPTPKTPYGEHLGADPSPDTRKFFKRRRDETMKFAEVFNLNPDELNAQKKRQEDWLNKKKLITPQDKDESMNEMNTEERSSESLDAKMQKNYAKKGQNWDDIGMDCADHHRNLIKCGSGEEEGGCLSGCVIMIAKKISQMNKELEEIVEDLGGEISHQLEDKTTHYIFQGNQREQTKEFKQAKELGKIIVAPEWIYMCRSEGRKVDESAFPYTYNPSRVVNQTLMKTVTSSGSAANKTKSRLTKSKIAQPNFQEEDETKIEEDNDNNITDQDNDNITDIPLHQNNETTIPGSATKNAESGYKKTMQGLQSLVDSLKNSPAVSILQSAKKEKQNKKGNTSLSDDTTPLTTPQKPVVPAESEKLESQVIWLDPDEQRNRDAITLKLSMETPDLGSINFSENMTAAFDMETTMETKKVFTITSGIDEMKAKEKIESLGGILDTNISLDNLPTHVIAVKVSRSEKMLLCIASGRWILHSSYLEDSVKAGKWLQESDYELGNPENQIIDLTADTPESKMCIAARKHRIAAEKGSKAVFSDLITYLALPSQKQLAFLRLIKAGGGTVVEELTTQTMKTLTHVITENKHFKMVESKAKQLSEYSIPLIIPLYLNDFLNNESIPLVENYLVEEYKPLWENMKGRQTSTRKTRK